MLALSGDLPKPPSLVSCAQNMLLQSQEQFRANIKTYPASRTSGCPANQELAALSTSPPGTRLQRQWLWHRGYESIRFIIASAEDHVLASIMQLNGPRIPVYAQSTLARAAAEAASQARYFLDPAIDGPVRLLRNAEYLRSGFAQQLAGAENLTDHPEGPKLLADCQQRYAKVMALLDSAHIEQVRGRKGGAAGLRFREGGPSVSAMPKISVLAASAIPEWPNWYSMFSATAHSLEWSISSAPQFELPDGELGLKPDLVELGCAAQLQIHALELLDASLAWFFGHPGTAPEKYRFRRKAIDMRIAEHQEARGE